MSSPPSAAAASATLAAAAWLADPSRRADAVGQLEATIGADQLLLFVPDPETDKLLPGPGFPQTLPGARGWRALLADCAARRRAEGRVVSPTTGAETAALAVRGDDGSVLVVLGGRPDESMLEQVRLVVPAVGAALRGEHAQVVAQAQAQLARSAAAEAETLSGSLDLARRELQRLYRQVRDALEFRDAFLAAAAHDLRTPLTAILGNAQMLRRQMERAGTLSGGHPDDRQRGTLEKIEASAGRMRRLVDQIVDVARLQMDQRLDLDRRPTDLVALARRVVAEHEPTTTRHAFRVEASDDPLVGWWDEARLERALDNLVGNAVKYSPAGGEVVVALHRERDDGEWAVAGVSDQGVGIPPEEIELVFERFHRAANAGGFVGSGIGLASVRQIVEEHGGRVALASTVGVGSTFTVRLPMARPEPGAC